MLDRAVGERERAGRKTADHGRVRVDGAEPAIERDTVEPGRVGMRPGIVGVDRGDERAVEALDPLVVGPLGRRREGPVLRADDALEEVVRRQSREAGIARLEREPELLHEAEVGGVERPHHLAAQLNRSPLVNAELLDAAAGPIARLEHDDVGAAGGQVARGSEAGEARTEHEHVRQAVPSSSAIAPRISFAARSRSTRPR